MAYDSKITFKSPFGFLVREFRDIGSSRRENITFRMVCRSQIKQTLFYVGSSMKVKSKAQKSDYLIVQIVSVFLNLRRQQACPNCHS